MSELTENLLLLAQKIEEVEELKQRATVTGVYRRQGENWAR